MGLLYVDEDSAFIGVDSNRIYAKYKDGMVTYIPIESLDSITILGKAEVSTGCIEKCLEKGILVLFFSKGGKYYGRMQSTGFFNAERQRLQCRLYDSEFALEFSKQIISAKLNNQCVVLRKYEKGKGIPESNHVKMIKICRSKLNGCKTIEEVNGYEGQAAKAYFKGLAELVKEDFKFNGRNRRPPRDPFNSMLSLGYSILMNEIYGKIESKGLNPFFGFMHKDKEHHPTLASDLMEEWRPIIVDSTVMSLINGNEITKEHFYMGTDEPGCFITRDGLKIFISKLEKKLQTETKYLTYIDYSVNFRYAINLQINSLIGSMMSEDASLYKPLLIR